LFTFNISPLLLWVLYVEHQIYQSRSRLWKMAVFLGAVFIANAVLAFLSLYHNLFFYFDDANVFHRGRFHWIAAVVYFSLLAYVLFLPIFKRAVLPARLRWPLILFSLPSVIGVVAQILMYGLNLTWAGSALSLLVIYTSIQNRILATDYLTGLYNRRQLDTFLYSRVRNIRPNEKLAVMMLDIDKFKSINDRLGHQVGDQALESTAAILRKTFHHQDFIARYAGDEFVVVFEYSMKEDLDSIKNRLQGKINQFNASADQPFTLSISMGTAVYDSESCYTAVDLLKNADQEMYEAKRAKFDRGAIPSGVLGR